MMLDITPIKAFSDNYLWLFKQAGSTRACIVDPGDAKPVLKYLEQHDLELEAILLTHHHADHIGGVPELLRHTDVPVYGPESKAIPYVTIPLHEGDTLSACETEFAVLEIPGHTLDHIAYFTTADKAKQTPLVFCGDTLFAAGCGRIFEGDPPMMYASLQKLAALDPATEVYCAHEYTMANLAFAQAVTPGDQKVTERLDKEQRKREQDIPTVPSNIARELRTNPFLRCGHENFRPQLPKKLSQKVPQNFKQAADTFAALRAWKDSF